MVGWLVGLSVNQSVCPLVGNSGLVVGFYWSNDTNKQCSISAKWSVGQVGGSVRPG